MIERKHEEEEKDRATEISMLSIKHRHAVEDAEKRNTWRSCCGKTIDRRAVMYFTQIAIISLTMLFTIYQLTTLASCESQSVYVGLLTMLLGILCPNPKFVK